ncbi:MAG TPA: hypothetical protein VF550_19830 [Polyangia bacterium]
MRVARFNVVALPLFLGFLGCSSGTSAGFSSFSMLADTVDNGPLTEPRMAE